MGMVDVLFNDAEPFAQIENTPSTENPMWNLWKLVQLFQKGRLKITIFYTCIQPRGKGR